MSSETSACDDGVCPTCLARALAAMTARAEAAERDGARLARLVEFVDGIGDVDLHERADLYASHRGNEEPDASDYLAAARDAIDAAIAKEQP